MSLHLLPISLIYAEFYPSDNPFPKNLDGVGLLDSRIFTNLLHHFVFKNIYVDICIHIYIQLNTELFLLLRHVCGESSWNHA